MLYILILLILVYTGSLHIQILYMSNYVGEAEEMVVPHMGERVGSLVPQFL